VLPDWFRDLATIAGLLWMTVEVLEFVRIRDPILSLGILNPRIDAKKKWLGLALALRNC
jgi:hypothetical protein